MKHTYISLWSMCFLLVAGSLFAGNPDRQGEAGAAQLLINPWARSAGLHSMNTSMVTGTDALYLNVAGLARINKTQLQLGHTRYLEGADININALGFGQRVGKGGAFGISLVAFDLGDFDLTTVNTPEGSGATFSPSFFNMGLSYAHLFANRVSVGVTVKFVNESISNAGASAMALDAGVQYVTGADDNFKFGISLRNVGGKMRFRGEGLGTQNDGNNETFEYPITYYQRSAEYELPSQLNIGASYDWLLGRNSRLSLLGTFTSNAFSRDQIGGGLEFSLNRNFVLRAGYKHEFEAQQGSTEASLDNGISGGLTVSIPLRKGSDSRFSIDYGYRYTEIFQGIHNIGLRIDL
ncbi:MAG: PorV/PorQ family protein [Bacteroidetes bacterium]|nr:MAG: PorV/PorQ family protein [Bacteroidota bacterium]